MNEIDQVAYEFYKVHCIGRDLHCLTWEQLDVRDKQGWRAVAQFFADALGQYMIVYGYNGKEPFESELDKLINGDR